VSPVPARSRHLRTLVLTTTLAVGGASLAATLPAVRAGADATLGGFTITAVAEGATVQYEQPNFPLPATPSVEIDEGYAATSDNFGPSGAATASTLYPGQVVANVGPQLALLVPGAPLPPAPVWPVQAVSNYPQAPNIASTDEPGVNMDAISTADGSSATASLGDDAPKAGASGAGGAGPASGAGNPLAASSALLGIGGLSGTASSMTANGTATSSASATDSGISILGGFITIGEVTSTATASSDGTTGTVSGSTVLTNVSIAGEPVTIGADGIAAAGKSNPLALPIASINSLLKELGISMAVTNPTDAVAGASASRTLDGLQIAINLDTLDTAVNTLAALLPASLLANLPLPLPNQQLLTVVLGRVSVSSDASPAFVNTFSPGTAGASGSDTTPSGVFTSPATGAFDSGSNLAGSGSLGSGAGGTGGSGRVSPSGPRPAPNVATSALAPLTAGIGAGLVLLFVLAAIALAYVYKRADDASEVAGSSCAEGDPVDLLGKNGAPISARGGSDR
jgi:hypothetical protein